MKLFLDTANVDQVAEIAMWGVLDGVKAPQTGRTAAGPRARVGGGEVGGRWCHFPRRPGVQAMSNLSRGKLSTPSPPPLSLSI